MALDDAASGVKGVFMDRAKWSDMEKERRISERKPDASLICSRCH